MTSGVTHKLQVDLKYEFRALSETFSQLSAKLERAAREMIDPGLPLSEPLLAEIVASQKAFAALRTQLLGLARIVESTPVPDPETVTSLKDLANVLQSAQETRKKSKMDEAKQQVLQKLDRVQSLTHKEKSEFMPLIDCQARAAQLKRAIAPVDWSNPSPDLVESLLPFVDLLRMVEQLNQLDDEAGERLQDTIAKAFGTQLAVAVVRGRVVLRGTASAATPVAMPAATPAVLWVDEPAVPSAASAPVAEAAPHPTEAVSSETLPSSAAVAPFVIEPAPASAAMPAATPEAAAPAELPPAEVEELPKLAAELYTRLGHEVQKTVSRADHLADLVIRSANGKRWLVRCRSLTSPVSEGEVRNFYGTLQQEKAVLGAIITLGSFTPQALKWAKRDLLYLLDQKKFLDTLMQARSRK